MVETVSDLIRALDEDRKKANIKRIADEKKTDRDTENRLKDLKNQKKKIDDANKKTLDNIAKQEQALLDQLNQNKINVATFKSELKILQDERKLANDDRDDLQKRRRENIEYTIRQREETQAQRRDDAKEKEKISKEKQAIETKKAAIDKKVAEMQKSGEGDAEKDADIVQARIDLIKDETELKNQGLTELQQRRNNQEANRKILEMEGRNADFNKKFQKEERKLQRAELKDRLSKATSGSEREEILKEQAAKDAKSLSVFNKIELGVRGLGDSFKERFKGMASAGAGLLKTGALVALLFLLPKLLNSPAAKKLVLIIQDKIIPAFKKVSETLDGIFGEGTGGLIATLSAIGLVLYGPSVIKLLFKAARGLVGGVMSLLTNSSTALGTDTKGMGKGKGRFAKLGRGIKALVGGGGKLAKGAGGLAKGVTKGAVGLAKGAGGVAKSAVGAATNVGKGIVKGSVAAGKTIAKTGPAAASKAAGLLKGGGKILAGAARFAGPVGLALTGGMAVFDGLSAGMEEFKKSGKLGKAMQEGLAGAASGLTFGLISQETISGGMSKIGNFFRPKKSEFEQRTGFKNMEEMEKELKKRGDSEAGVNIEKKSLRQNTERSLAVRREHLAEMFTHKYMTDNMKRAGDFRRIMKERKQLAAQVKKDEQMLKEMGINPDLSDPDTLRFNPDLKARVAGKTTKQIINEGIKKETEGGAAAPVIINNDASVRSNSSNTQVKNETITSKDGMLVSAISDI